MTYLVKQNFKNGGVYYKIGQSWQSNDDALILHLLGSGLITLLADESPSKGDMGGKDENLSSPPSEGLDSEMGEDLGGYEDDGSYVKPKKGKKKKG